LQTVQLPITITITNVTVVAASPADARTLANATDSPAYVTFTRAALVDVEWASGAPALLRAMGLTLLLAEALQLLL
jgi:hypothetical protein